MLKFIYGVMGSSKTAQALITNYNFNKIRGYKTVLMKPALDTRTPTVSSRIGLSAPCYLFGENENLIDRYNEVAAEYPDKTLILIIDEAQFCTPQQINELRYLGDRIDVYCYGLKTTFKRELFPSSKALLELADSVEEIPYTCVCGRPAIYNALFKNGVIQESGADIQIGDTEYKAICNQCYEKYLELKREKEDKK